MSIIKVPYVLKEILDFLLLNNTRPYIVGGVVRDYFLNNHYNKDYDIEVYNISYERLYELLSNFGKANCVGKSFGVIKLNIDKFEFDFSLPRKENKISSGHRGFLITTDKSLNTKEASKRRDFTCNAIMYDYKNDTFIDHFKGIKDIKNKILRYVDKNSFIEDPLRVYRAVQFCARFEFDIEKETFILCKSLVSNLNELPKERVWQEFKKLLLKSDKPSIGLNLLKELEILKIYFPEIFDIIGVPQDPNHHSEGDVWIHTLKVVDCMADLTKEFEEKKRLILLLSALCHDLGKAKVTKMENGKIISYGHEDESVSLAISFISKLTDDKRLINLILPLVKYHYAPSTLYKQKAKKSAIKRLTVKLSPATLEELVIVAEADYYGRDTTYIKEDFNNIKNWILTIAKEQDIMQNAPKRLVQGRDLIKCGLSPSPKFKEILDKAYELQIENENLSKDEILNHIL